jgi:hypothetical protein
MCDQLSFKEYIDPFADSKNNKAEYNAALAAVRGNITLRLADFSKRLEVLPVLSP